MPAAWRRGAPAHGSKGGGRVHSGKREDVAGWTAAENKEGGLSNVVGWGWMPRGNFQWVAAERELMDGTARARLD